MKEAVSQLLADRPFVEPSLRAGDVLLFDELTVHRSGSPRSRTPSRPHDHVVLRPESVSRRLYTARVLSPKADLCCASRAVGSTASSDTGCDETVERDLHRCGASGHHLVDDVRELVGFEVRDPLDDRRVVGLLDRLRRTVVVLELWAVCRPDQAVVFLVDGDDRLRIAMPFANVTIRALPSMTVSTTKPGTSRVCSAPMSRIADQTSRTGAVVSMFFVMDAIRTPQVLVPGTASARMGQQTSVR